jgi:hypothetical protein
LLVLSPTTRHAFQFPIFHLSKWLLVTTPTTARLNRNETYS